jgi:hypothetical protein
MHAQPSDRRQTTRSGAGSGSPQVSRETIERPPKWRAFACFIYVLVAGCATERVRYEKDPPLGSYDIVLSAIGYDEKGLPVLDAALTERSSKPGDHFTVVRFREGKPAISYDIVVARQAPDFARPLEVVYEWTGRGFTMGVNVVKAMGEGMGRSGVRLGGSGGGREAAIVLLVIVVAPIAASTTGGFIVGVADGARHTVLEVRKAIVPGEQLITCTTFKYDSSNRLVLMRMLSPDQTRELVRTEFEYEGSETVPSRTTVRTQADPKRADVK